MPRLLYSNETAGCRAAIELDSGEACIVSIEPTGVLVHDYHEGSFLTSTVGTKLFNEESVDAATRTALLLGAKYPNNRLPAELKNKVLAAFANAIWHCASLADVSAALKTAGSAARKAPFVPS